jgi:hypothetical protein
MTTNGIGRNGIIMEFDVFFEEEHLRVEVDEQDVLHGQPFFQQMDKDMDVGRRMGPEYVHDLDITQRCQVVAERLMLAIEERNATLARAMAAYIVWRIPNIRELHIDTSGEPQLTEIVV